MDDTNQHLQPEVLLTDWVVKNGNGSTQVVLAGLRLHNLPCDLSNFTTDEIKLHQQHSHIVRGYCSRLQSPGYLDCTEWLGPFETEVEAYNALMMTQYDDNETTEACAALHNPPAKVKYCPNLDTLERCGDEWLAINNNGDQVCHESRTQAIILTGDTVEGYVAEVAVSQLGTPQLRYRVCDTVQECHDDEAGKWVNAAICLAVDLNEA